jgi:hypothetical protein
MCNMSYKEQAAKLAGYVVILGRSSKTCCSQPSTVKLRF